MNQSDIRKLLIKDLRTVNQLMISQLDIVMMAVILTMDNSASTHCIQRHPMARTQKAMNRRLKELEENGYVRQEFAFAENPRWKYYEVVPEYISVVKNTDAYKSVISHKLHWTRRPV